MARNHFQKYHSGEGPIKRCLRCLINDLKSQNDKLQDDLKYITETQNTQKNTLQNEIEGLQDKVTHLEDELKLARDRKEYYKSKYYNQKD